MPVKNSYLLTFPDDKAEILAVYMSKSYWGLGCLILLIFYKLFLNRNGLLDDKVVLFTKSEYGSLV